MVSDGPHFDTPAVVFYLFLVGSEMVYDFNLAGKNKIFKFFNNFNNLIILMNVIPFHDNYLRK